MTVLRIARLKKVDAGFYISTQDRQQPLPSHGIKCFEYIQKKKNQKQYKRLTNGVKAFATMGPLLAALIVAWAKTKLDIFR